MPAVHTGLNWLSPGFVTSVPWRNLMTSFAGMRKLKPCTIAPPDGESETNVITPTSEASSVTAGPPLLPCAAGASLWMTSWPIASCLKPDTAPLVTEASSVTLRFSSSCERTTPGKPRIWTGSPIWLSRVESVIAG